MLVDRSPFRIDAKRSTGGAEVSILDRAMELIADGECKNWAAAAKRIGVSRAAVSKALRRP